MIGFKDIFSRKEKEEEKGVREEKKGEIEKERVVPA